MSAGWGWDLERMRCLAVRAAVRNMSEAVRSQASDAVRKERQHISVQQTSI